MFWRLGRGDTFTFTSLLTKRRKSPPRGIEGKEVERLGEAGRADLSKTLQFWSPVELPDNQMPSQELDGRCVIIARDEGKEVVHEVHGDFVPA